MPMKKMLFYVKSCSLFDTFLKYLFNIIQVSSVVCYKFVFKEFCKNITFTLILLMLILLGNDIPENPGPFDNEISIFHLNIRSIRHRLYFRKETTSFIKQFNFLAWNIKSRRFAGVSSGSVTIFFLYKWYCRWYSKSC